MLWLSEFRNILQNLENFAKTIEDLKQTGQDLTKALSIIKKHQAIEKTLSLANQYCSEAINALDVFPHSETKLALESLAKLAVNRVK